MCWSASVALGFAAAEAVVLHVRVRERVHLRHDRLALAVDDRARRQVVEPLLDGALHQRAAVVVPLDRRVPVRGVQVQGPRRHLLVRVRRAELRRRFRGRGGLGGARRDDGGGRRHDFTARGRLSDGFCWLTA